MAKPSARDVACYFLSLVDPNEGESISPLKLQKLVYYAQGFHLALYDKTLFPEQIEAWRYGPVIPSLYKDFKEHGDSAIPAVDGFDPEVFTPEQRKLLDDVYETYGQFSAWKLRDMTHEEAPWKDADGRGGGVISSNALRVFFRTQLEK
jgi:uncharacterized phage-associated protein